MSDSFALSNIPNDYCIHIFYRYANKPRRQGANYVGGCPICREGKNWGKKQRACYFPDKNFFYCHNDNESYSPYQWIKLVTGWDYQKIHQDVVNFCGPNLMDKIQLTQQMPASRTSEPLPRNSIDITDEHQFNFYRDSKIIQHARQFIIRRKLVEAQYSCGRFFVSLDDSIHRNRLVIPYYNSVGIVDSYQTRALDDTVPKYLSKLNSPKSLFNLQRIDPAIGVIFVTEGSIDAMFVRNAVACSGIHLSPHQQQQLQPFAMFNRIIRVTDNQYLDKTGREKTIELAEQGNEVFVWPKSWAYKDFNEMAIARGTNEIDYTELLPHIRSGKGLVFSV